MFAVVMKGICHLEYEDFPYPVPGDDEVLIDIYASGICGSDMHRYTGEEPIKNTKNVCGHELGGTVLATGKNIKNLKIGQKVTVNPKGSCGECRFCKAGLGYLCMKPYSTKAMTEQFTAREKQCVVMPDDFDLLYAPMVEPAAAAIHVTRGIEKQKVVLFGLGPVGLFVLQMLVKQGNEVVACDISEDSLKNALDFGAAAAVDLKAEDANEQILEKLGGEPPMWILDGVGISQTLERALELCEKRGTVRIFGASRINIDFNCRKALLKEIRVESSYIFEEDDYRAMAEMFAKGEIRYKELVAKVFPLTQAKEAFEYKRTHACGKVLLKHKD